MITQKLRGGLWQYFAAIVPWIGITMSLQCLLDTQLWLIKMCTHVDVPQFAMDVIAIC